MHRFGWESGTQTVVNSGTMCVVNTSEAVFGVTNDHVLTIYEKHIDLVHLSRGMSAWQLP